MRAILRLAHSPARPRSLFECLASPADRRAIVNWHEAAADARATAAWLRSNDIHKLLCDKKARDDSAALISLDQLALCQHVVHNNSL